MDRDAGGGRWPVGCVSGAGATGLLQRRGCARTPEGLCELEVLPMSVS